MDDFNGDIVFNDKVLHVRFMKVFSNHHKYFIEVGNGELTLASCELCMSRQGSWDILPPVPFWIYEIKEELIKLLKQSDWERDSQLRDSV